MKNTTAQTVALAAIGWIDARQARTSAKKSRNEKAAEFHAANDGDPQDRDEEYWDELKEYTASEQAIYMAALKADQSARSRLTGLVRKAKKEIEGGDNG